MSLLAGAALRSSMVLLLGLVLEACLRKRSAAARHCVLAATVFAAALVVPLGAALPAWEVSLPPLLQERALTTTAPASAVAPRVTNAPSPAPAPSPAHAASRTLAAAGILVWFAGFLVAAAALLGGVARLLRIAARSERVQEIRWTRILADVAAGYGLRREVVILQTGTPDILATWGVRRPRVLLPAHARDWADDRVHAVLCHELAHIRRSDWLVQIGAEAIRTLLWFNPLVWIACTRLRRESEQACDDAVLDRGVPARDYASHLLELARKCRRPGPAWVSAMPMAHPSTLERRIAAMLNPRLNRRALSRRLVAATGALLLAITVPIGALRAGQAAPATLSGSVYDTSGAVMPGVELTLEDATQSKWTAVTNASGRFEFPNVQPGHYVLAAAIPGFRSLRQEFELRTARDWDRAITLQVGTLTETITVRESRLAAAPQPSRTQTATPLRVGGNVRAPRKELDVKPIYPASMRQAGREGVVPMEAIIGVDGTVTSVRVLSAQVHPDFAIAAVDAVRQWRFSSTLLNGVPVEVVMNVSVTFNLAD